MFARHKHENCAWFLIRPPWGNKCLQRKRCSHRNDRPTHACRGLAEWLEIRGNGKSSK